MLDNALKFLGGGTTSIILGILLLILGIWYASWKSDYEKRKAQKETDDAKSEDQKLGRGIQKNIDQDDAAAKKAVDGFLDGNSSRDKKDPPQTFEAGKKYICVSDRPCGAENLKAGMEFTVKETAMAGQFAVLDSTKSFANIYVLRAEALRNGEVKLLDASELPLKQ